MSLVFNMVGGGSGGSLKDTDAILTVTVPTGSTVTATKGSTSLTPTMWVQAADTTLDCALFAIPQAQFDSANPWTVTATLGTDSATATVLIGSNKQYDVELSYGLYIVKNGSFANGYSFPIDLRSGQTPEITENVAGYLRMKMPGSYSIGAATNLIDLSEFSTLNANAYVDGGDSYVGVWPGYGYSSREAIANAATAKQTVTTSESLLVVDIANLQNSYYVGGSIGTSGSTSYSLYISNMWLKR